MARERRLRPVTGVVGYDISIDKKLVKRKHKVKKATTTKARGEDLAYGEPVYWLTILGSVVVITGGVLAFCTKANYVATSYWISSVWQGHSTEEIWEGAVNSEPQGHWYLSHLFTGDGLQSLGLAISFLSITLGLLAAGIVLFRKKSMVFAIFALTASAIMIVSIFGVIPE